MRRLLTFVLAGVVAQLVDGALGMAYGVTATSVLLTGGTAPAVASATVHLAEVGTTFVSGLSHWRFGNVSWRLVGLLGVPGAVGGYLGASVLTGIDGDAAKPWISTLLVGLGVVVLGRFTFGRTPVPLPESRLRARSMGPLGAVAGFVDAIGGGGWGPITTPTLLTVGRVEPRRAIGTVSASEFLVSLAASVGFLTQLSRDEISLRVVVALLAGGIVTAPLAALLVRRLDIRVTGTLVGSLVILTNARTLLSFAGLDPALRAAILLGLGGGAVALVLGARRRARDDSVPREPTAGVATG